MANRLPKEISDFMEKWDIRSDELWQVHGSTHVIKHKALERAAAKAGIVWDRPAIIEQSAERNIAVICVFGKLGERTEWSIGEASPSNYRVTGKMAAYPYAMAEKRGKDRCILKLLNAHGDIYSDEEADDFKRPNPHVTRPSDVMPPLEYDQHGEVIDNIPAPSPEAVKKLRVVDQRPIFDAMQKEIQATGSIAELQKWAEENKDRLGSLKPDWQDFLRGVYAEHRDAIRQLEAGDDMRMTG
jgi:hypothetical protein